jgi:hypothetical protein
MSPSDLGRQDELFVLSLSGLELDTNTSHPSRTEVKNAWSFTSTPSTRPPDMGLRHRIITFEEL